ncbi:MAG: type II methionyl aminopeptidase [Candidatus Aenigmarchaeota archaeon]|nr:type II methionyl aminopeptidase [Candidatus Aenigmarchaeota archaeon]
MVIKIEKDYTRTSPKIADAGKHEHSHAHIEEEREDELKDNKIENDDYSDFIKAGKIVGEILKETEEFVKPGAKLLDIANKIENMIRGKGGEVAFPVNLSLNTIAAHYTPTYNDETIVTEKDVLKVDIGAHSDGCVADAARTFCFNPDYDKLTEASKKALEEAIKLCKPGALISDISAVIEDTITGYGYKPIQNLTGHGVGQYIVHMEPTIPNIKHKSGKTLEEGMIIAIEPFATDGKGHVRDSQPIQIYRIYGMPTVRGPEARKLTEMSVEWMGLPFAERWIRMESQFKVRMALKELRDRGALHEYAPLKEDSNGMVSQHEHTVIIKDEPVVVTKF